MNSISAVSPESYMKKALAEAAKAAEEGEVPVGAVIVEDGHIVGRAHNRVEALHDPTAHAEMIAITQAAEHRGDWRLNGMTLFTTVEPCPMCAGAIILARIDQVVYGAADPRAGAAGSAFNILGRADHIHKVKVFDGMCADESSDLLRKFFTKRRNDER